MPKKTFSDKKIKLSIWSPPDKGTRLILPIFDGKSHEEVAVEYLERLNRSENYAEMLRKYSEGSRQAPSAKHFSSIPKYHRRSKRVPIAVIANRPGHMTLNDRSFAHVHESFSRHGADIYVVPLGLETLLHEELLRLYHHLVSETFPCLMSIGGPDMDPSLYGQKNHGLSKETNRQRDLSEKNLVYLHTQKEDRVFYGICRGHQLYCVATGGELHQDIADNNNSHSVPKNTTDEGTKSAHHVNELPSCQEDNTLKLILGNKTHFISNSRHHQAISRVPEGARVIAFSGAFSGASLEIIEALDKKTKKGQIIALTLQFHPEDTHLDGGKEEVEDARKIIEWMVNNIRNFLS